MPERAGDVTQRSECVLRNARGTGMKVIREPWADEFTVPPGGALEILAVGPAGHRLEIEIHAEGVIVWGWPGSVVDVYSDGVKLTEGSQPVPRVPAGMSVRGFLGMVLNDPPPQEE